MAIYVGLVAETMSTGKKAAKARRGYEITGVLGEASHLWEVDDRNGTTWYLLRLGDRPKVWPNLNGVVSGIKSAKRCRLVATGRILTHISVR